MVGGIPENQDLPAFFQQTADLWRVLYLQEDQERSEGILNSELSSRQAHRPVAEHTSDHNLCANHCCFGYAPPKITSDISEVIV